MSIEFGIRGILNTLPVLSQTTVALEKIESLGLSLAEPVSEPDFPTGSDFELVGRCFASSLSNQASDWTSLELVDIHHAYWGEEHRFALDNINLQFKPGEIVFIVGGNGSGKSTLVKLITGLYTPDRGKILFNNIAITDDNHEWYRQQFLVVFYDFYLFDILFSSPQSLIPNPQSPIPSSTILYLITPIYLLSIILVFHLAWQYFSNHYY